MQPPTLDPLQTYLAIANLAALVVFGLHHILRRLGPSTGVSELVLCLLSAAGGAPVAALMDLLFDRRLVKENAWHHVVVASTLVIWGVVLGFAYVRPLDPDAFLAHLHSDHRALGICVALASAIAFVAFGVDKRRATRGRWRIPEAVLLGLSMLGGSPGALVAMRLFRHKVNSPQFSWGVPLIMVAQVALLAWLVNAGLV